MKAGGALGFAKGHNLNPGNYSHFEVNGAKSELQYMVS